MDGRANEQGETVRVIALLQLFFELRREHVEELGVADQEREMSIGGAKDDGVARGAAADRASKMMFDGLDVRAKF